MKTVTSIEEQMFQNSIEKIVLVLGSAERFLNESLNGDISECRKNFDISKHSLSQLRGFLDHLEFVFVSPHYALRIRAIVNLLYSSKFELTIDCLLSLIQVISLYKLSSNTEYKQVDLFEV